MEPLQLVRLFVSLAFVAALPYVPIAGAQSQSAFNYPNGSTAIIQTDNGAVGSRVANDVVAFKGIPFAAPPVGDLRWRAPQPVKPWQGVREAAAYSADPMQPAAGGSLPSFLPPNPAGNSEDCLYLNVWRPAKADGKPLPVMVWIYGGGLVRGGASIYPGEFLAKQGIVVVTFNYRVGRLGFFAYPLGKETPNEPRGNYGYMDQIAALKWVQANIRAFGGDPNQVTIAGESAGGGSVLMMLTSPMARGLFQRAILQSPAMPSPRAAVSPVRSLAEAETTAFDYANSLGITGKDGAMLPALRALPAEKLIEGTEQYAAAIFGGPQIPGLSFAIVDGRLVAETPESTLRTGRQPLVPVMVGANDYDLALGPAQTKDDLFAFAGPLADRARKLYDPAGNATFESVSQSLVCDRAMIEPSRHLAELVSASGRAAYFYRFSYVAQSQRAAARGATHGTEIVYAFDAAGTLLREKLAPADTDMSRAMSGYWVDFIKTGNPNGSGRPEWAPFDADKRDVFQFTNQGPKMGPDPLKDRLDFWRDVWSGRR